MSGVDAGGKPPALPIQPLTADEICDEFWQEVARRHVDGAAYARLSHALPTVSWDLPEPVPLITLLNLDGAEFIVAAYATLLGRGPDQAGIAYCSQALETGAYSKLELLGQLQASGEARSLDRRLPGLRRRYYVRRLYRLPLLGPVLRVLAGGLRRIGFSRLLAPQGS